MGLQVHFLDVTPVSVSYLLLGGFVVFFSMISLLAKEKLYIGESVLATAFGIIIGPHGANIFNPRAWSADSNAITLEVMRITLATGLFAIGVELPRAYLARHWRSLTIMVVPTMAIGWVTSAGFMFALFPGLSFVSALCISACLTPTDPILAVAITSGEYALKHVPANIRRLLAAESAANDGLAYPFLSLSLYLTIESSKRTALGKWFLVGWLYQVVLGIVLGTCLGFSFCHIMKFAHRKRFIDRESYVAQYIALAVLSIGLTSLLGSDDLLAAFAAGTAISWDGEFNEQTENAIFSSVIDLVLNCGAFIYIGAWLPFASYNSPELGISPWRLVVLFLCLLAFRRLPSLLILYKWVPDIYDWREALFSGHFGPMGVGAIFISTMALSKLEQPQNPPQNQEARLAASLHPIVSFVVLGSIMIHGLSIPFFNIGRRTVSLTSSWSRPTPSRGPPEWLTLTRRIIKPIVRIDSAVEAPVERGKRPEASHASLSESPTLAASNQSTTKQIEFDSDIFVEGRRVAGPGDGVRLAATGNFATLPEREYWREDAVAAKAPTEQGKRLEASHASLHDEGSTLVTAKQVGFDSDVVEARRIASGDGLRVPATGKFATLLERERYREDSVAAVALTEQGTRPEASHASLNDESPTVVMTAQPVSALDMGPHPDGDVAATRTITTNQSTKQVGFDSDVVVEGKRIAPGDGLRLSVTGKFATTPLERERKREDSVSQSPSSPGPSVQFRE